MDTGQSTCEDNEELFSVWILLGFMCEVGVKLFSIVKSKVFPSMSRNWTWEASWFHVSPKQGGNKQ